MKTVWGTLRWKRSLNDWNYGWSNSGGIELYTWPKWITFEVSVQRRDDTGPASKSFWVGMSVFNRWTRRETADLNEGLHVLMRTSAYSEELLSVVYVVPALGPKECIQWFCVTLSASINQNSLKCHVLLHHHCSQRQKVLKAHPIWKLLALKLSSTPLIGMQNWWIILHLIL